MDYLLSDINFRAAALAGILTDATFKGVLLILGAYFLHKSTRRSLFRGSRFWFFVLLLLFILGALSYYQPFYSGGTVYPWLAFHTPEPDFSFSALPLREGLSPWFWFGAIWLLGVMAHYIRLTFGLRHLHSLTQGGKDISPELQVLVSEARVSAKYTGPCRIQIHSDCAGPLTFIHRTPWILLPEGSEKWDQGALKAALIHEFIHVRRKDFYWSLIGRVLSGLFWFLPPVWFIMRQFRLSQELECDRAVVMDGGLEATDYATVLMTLSRTGSGAPVLATALGTSSLEVRITNLLFPGKKEGKIITLGIIFLGFLGVFFFLAASPPLAGAEPNFFKLMQIAQDLQTYDDLDANPRLQGLPLAWPVEAGLGYLENCRFEAQVGALSYPIMQEGVKIYGDFTSRVLSAGRGKVIRVLGNPRGFTVSIQHDHDVIATYSDLGRLGSIYVGKLVDAGTVMGFMGYYPQKRFGFAMSIQKAGRNIDPSAFINCGYERIISPLYSP